MPKRKPRRGTRNHARYWFNRALYAITLIAAFLTGGGLTLLYVYAHPIRVLCMTIMPRWIIS